MTISRLSYRARQFRLAVCGPKRQIQSAALQPYLSPVQIVLFQRLQASEQTHAVRVLERLKKQGHAEPDLLAAALLHDIGKILSPLSIIERMAIVLGRRLFPAGVKRWGQGSPRGLRHAFAVAEQHPRWGADLAAQAGASSRTVDLIARHQEVRTGPPRTQTERMLAALQAADDSD